MTSSAPDLDIAPAAVTERPILANLLQLYIHDFSEYWSGDERGELEGDGRFSDYPLDGYWSAPGRVPLLLRLGGRLAGFALLDDHAHAERRVDWNMAEFFVVRKHRGAGVGRVAAQRIFSRYPGVWEVAVARRNARALPFWRNAIASHPDVRDFQQHDLATDAWNGPLFRFRVKAEEA